MTRTRRAVGWLLRPIEQFFRIETASGLILLSAVLLALVWANSPWSATYARIWRPAAAIGHLDSVKYPSFWINDGLMTLFFLLVGLELRREFRDGVLSSFRQATFPIAAAVGGMIVPALIYLSLNRAPILQKGWGIPTATDIAFSIGVLALLGKRVPASLRVFLLALAIVDDILSVLIVAVFYPSGLVASGFFVAVGGVLGILAFRRLGVTSFLAYLIPGAIVWMGVLRTGVHPAIAGVAVGLLIPVTAEGILHPWVAYGVTPLFALANAGLAVRGLALDHGGSMTVFAGVLVGRVVGKPVGILLASVATVMTGLCALPRDVTWRGLLLIGCLGGIGFTVSIFIASVAFSDPLLLGAAKLALLVASASSAAIALFLGRRLGSTD